MSNSFRSNYTFGGVIAETDPLLEIAFYDNGDFDAIESPEDPRRFIIGSTGSGKSASFKHLEELHPGKVVKIFPEDLSLHYLTNLDIIQKFLNAGVKLDPFLKALWKHVIVVQVIQHKYKLNTRGEQKQNFIAQFTEMILRNVGKAKATEYIQLYGESFWNDAEECVKQVTTTLEKKVLEEFGVEAKVKGVGVSSSLKNEEGETVLSQEEVRNKYQKIVNESQIPRLTEMLEVLNSMILKSKQDFLYLVIDDLDKEWVDEKLANLLIRCLFETVLDMTNRVKQLKILVALRTNIFQQLEYGKHGRGSQEEKVRGLALNLRWTENDLRCLLNQRAKAASTFYQLTSPWNLDEMFPKPNNKRDPINYILTHTLMRPRDAILFLNVCLREAVGKDQISWDNIWKAEKLYSDERLIALREEWKDPFLDIDYVFKKFAKANYRLSIEDITPILDSIVELLVELDFQGKPWLKQLCGIILADGSSLESWYGWYGPIIGLLYNISFLGIAKGPLGRPIYYYQEIDRAQRASEFIEPIYFEIHPAFRSALNIIVHDE